MSKELEKVIEEANKAYRDGVPVMGDSEYDDLVESLRNEDPDNPILKKAVIEKPSGRMEALPIPMYSLEKCKSVNDLIDWIDSKKIPKSAQLVLTPKYDGISLCVKEFVKRGWTRGDGVEGQRSDTHLKTMDFNYSNVVSNSYGEAIISRKNWDKYFEGQINPRTKTVYSNARNTVGGMFNSPEPVDTLKHVDYVRYGSSEDVDKKEMVNNLNSNQSSVPTYTIFAGGLLDDNFESVLDDLYQKWNQNYAIDGIVIDVNDRELRKSLGREKNMNPAYARAFKNPKWSQGGKSKVNGVTIQVSKQGKLKPVINISPVVIGGVIIKNVTGYNMQYMVDNDIAEGSEIELVRSGDVIPKHIKTLSFVPENVQSLIDDCMECPSCGEPTVWDKTMTELICINPKCKEQIIHKLVHFFKIMEVEDFGEPSIRSFYEAGHKSIFSILNLSIEDICKIEGFAKTSAKKLTKQFDVILNSGVPAAKLLHAMDLFNGKCGEKVLQNIFNGLETDSYTFEFFNNLKVTTLTKIRGVSKITADVFLEGVSVFYVTDFMGSIKISHWASEIKKKKEDGKMFGQAVCFTGFRSESLEGWVEDEGGEIKSGVSKKLTILLVDDLDSGSSKLRKAKDLGIEILTKDQFEDKYM